MTTMVQARDTLVAYVDGNWAHKATVPLFYENAEQINLPTAGTAFAFVEVLFDGAKQAEISRTPSRRIYGTLAITVFAKEGTGTRTTLGYADELANLLAFLTLSGVHLRVPAVGREKLKDGWFSLDVRTPFFFDSNT